ncbi:MAG: N-6 DNA methylase [Spirochaetota bacterium]
MSKLKGKPTKVPYSFDLSSHKTERSSVAILMHWMREIIGRKNLDLGMPDVDTSGSDRKSPDTVIYESRRSEKILCVIEAKPPYYDVFNEKELKKPAWEKANARKAKYFALTNFRNLVLFNTEKVNALCPEEEQIVGKYNLSELENLNNIEETRYSESIKKGLEDFLTKLYSREPEHKLAIDEFLVYRLHEKIRVLSTYYKRIIDDKYHKDSSFAKNLCGWFNSQGWDFAEQDQDFYKAARQTAYLLINKILFYNVLQAKRPQDLDPLEIPKGLTKGAMLQGTLQNYFQQVLNIDYENIYTTDFIDTVAFPEAKEVVNEIKELVGILRQYDFSTLGYDIIGRIFERLIPEKERHNLGQYFTSPDVVDLILRFCLCHEDDKILDPACGAGTFLVRAYQHKKIMNQRKKHEEILETLWGTDIAKFPAHLATINLAINDLGVDKNYPNILQEDFFNLLVGIEGFNPEKWRKARATTLRIKEREVTYPRWFDAVVGNPPYTRQEEISEISTEDAEYKEKLIKNALYFNNGKIADIGLRAGIHAYFFVHGTKFLKDGGHFGFIVNNSWLDVDYGKGLQEFFLKNYKIVAIIESKIERWFEEADINTCIVILQKSNNKKECDENLVRFVYLKKPLRYFVPPAKDIWEKQIERQNSIDKLKKTILAHNDFYENEELKIFPKNQKELWDEGFNLKEDKYAGTKWGKYLRVNTPLIYFKILKKGDRIFVSLQKTADIKPGCYTGINDFFYIERRPEYKDKIEKKFLKPIIRNTSQIRTIFTDISEINDYVFVCRLSKQELRRSGKDNTLRYIKWGETQVTRRRQKVDAGKEWKEVETVKNRKPGWWAIPLKTVLPAQIFMIYVINDRFIVSYSENPIASDRCLHRIFPQKGYNAKVLTAILNSTLTIFNIEIYGRSNLGLGALKFETMDAKQIPIVDQKKIKTAIIKKLEDAYEKLKNREIGNIFDEVCAFSPEEVSLDKVKPDRRELDKIIMGDILGLTDDEQLEVYRAVIDLVKSRIERAKSFGNNKKTKNGFDMDSLANSLLDRIDGDK